MDIAQGQKTVCAICSFDGLEKASYPHAKDFLFKQVQFVSCPQCEASYIHSGCSSEALHEFYEKRYSVYWGRFGLVPPQKYFGEDKFQRKPRRSKAQLTLARQYFKGQPESVLDIGAGLGTTLFYAKQMFGAKTQLLACEPDRVMHEYLTYINTRIFRDMAEVESNSADIIISSHALEHVLIQNIPTQLIEMKRCLSERGVIVIEVPHSNVFRYPQVWDVEHEPHAIFFSRQALEKVVLHSGLKIKASFCSGTPFGFSWQFQKYKAMKLLSKFTGRALHYGGDDLSHLRMVLSR